MSAGRAHRLAIIVDLKRGPRQRGLVKKISAEKTRLDHRDMDAERRHFARQCFADAFDRKFCCAVDAPAGITRIAADRREIDDMARTLPAPVRQDCAGDAQQAEYIGAEQLLGFAGAVFLVLSNQADDYVVDTVIETSELLDPKAV